MAITTPFSDAIHPVRTPSRNSRATKTEVPGAPTRASNSGVPEVLRDVTVTTKSPKPRDPGASVKVA